MAISATIPAIQSWYVNSAVLQYSTGTGSLDLVAGSTNGRRVYTITCYSNGFGPGNTNKLIIDLYDGTDTAVLYVTDLVNTKYTQQLSVTFSEMVLPSSATIRARVEQAVNSGSELQFTIRAGDY